MNTKQTYTHEEALKASLDYFEGDELAARVWVNKYAMKDSFGNIYEQSPTDMHWRLANEIARIEQKYPNPMSAEEVFALLDHFRYIVPAGSPMTGIGNNHQIASLSNCFVIGLDGNADSYGAIMRIDEAGAADETTRWRGPRPEPYPSEGLSRKQLGPDLYRSRAIHGALQQLDTRGGTRRTPGCPHALCQHQASRQ